MTTLAERMGGYAAYHRDPRNKFTHLFGVPLAFYSPLIALGWLRLPLSGGFEISLAMVVLALVMIWYIKLDWIFGTVMTLISVPVMILCDMASQLPFLTSLAVFIGVTILAWTIQLIGHAYEGRKPALADNLVQSLMGPIFVLAEVVFAMGLRKDLHMQVEKLAVTHVFADSEPASA
ncbi:MAG: DUF962 domain-containing protein [bacterium]|nr:DUF962 domain-containing protein [bacterium]